MSKSLYDLIENDASVEEIKAAIAEGADVNEIKAYRPVLLLAVERKKGADVVRALLEAGAEVDRYITKDDLTDEDKETMEEEGIGLYDCVGITQWAPLHSAITDNDLEVAKLLLEAGADVNLKTGHDEGETCTPLGQAHTKESIELLIEYGADVHQKYGLEGYDDEGNPYSQDINTKLHWDLHRLDPECVLLLLRAGATTWEIDEYIEKHPEVDADVFRSLAEENNNSSQDDDWEDDDDWGFGNYSDDETEDEDEENDEEEEDDEDEEAKSPSLCNLIENDASVEEIKEAIANGADVNEKHNGKTPLHIAAQGSWRADIVRALVEVGADVEARDNDGFTPLHLAALNSVSDDESDEGVKALIESGADVNAKTSDWCQDQDTPLHLALGNTDDYGLGSLAVIRTLIEAGADVNARNGHGYTPLRHLKFMEVGWEDDNHEIIEPYFTLLRQAGAEL